MKIKMYCSCGASLVGSITPDKKADEVVKIWNENHSRTLHTPCTANQAAYARHKSEHRKVTEV